MAVLSRATIGLWPVALVAVLGPAVPIGFHLAGTTCAPLALPSNYPIRLELPAASPSEPVDAAPSLEFDLAGSGAEGGSGGSAVEMRKAVRLNGAEAGSAAIRVSADSTLSISADELRALLVRAGRGDLAGQIAGRDGVGRFLGFEEMRALGIDIRFDAAGNRILIGA